jgi:hypothetical protein
MCAQALALVVLQLVMVMYLAVAQPFLDPWLLLVELAAHVVELVLFCCAAALLVWPYNAAIDITMTGEHALHAPCVAG